MGAAFSVHSRAMLVSNHECTCSPNFSWAPLPTVNALQHFFKRHQQLASDEGQQRKVLGNINNCQREG